MKYDVISILCNPIRLRILLCIGKKRKHVQELVETCKLSQSAVSQHLQKLKNAGLVKTEKEKQFIYYSIMHKRSIKVAGSILKYVDFINKERNAS